MIMILKQKKIKFKPRINLNHNIHATIAVHCGCKISRWWCHEGREISWVIIMLCFAIDIVLSLDRFSQLHKQIFV